MWHGMQSCPRANATECAAHLVDEGRRQSLEMALGLYGEAARYSGFGCHDGG